ncbi:MAG: ATP-binding cassette domain-containing protein [Myxococcales bacterium]|nr:ATP-binding cassette domain-containing protein [Myxococcales bacterium]
MTAPALDICDLAAGYGEKLILRGVDLTVQRGEVRVVLGGSGCGKSTLMKSCIGLVPMKQGTVKMLGEELVNLEGPARARLLTRIGVLFQYGALLGSITIGDNVALPLREHTDLPPDVIAEIVRLKLSLVELSHAEHLLPSELSGGMRKRAALARAMALDPELLFCDEPGAGLDPLTSAELDELLLRLRDRFGMAVVVVTHELLSIEKIADKVVYLSKGKVLADGTLDEVRHSEHDEIRAFFDRLAAGEMRGPRTALEALAPDLAAAPTRTKGQPAPKERR